MATKYIDPNAPGGGTGNTTNDPWNWSEFTAASGNTYLVRSGTTTTITTDTNTGFIDISGLSSVTVGKWDDGGADPIFEIFRNITTETWTEDTTNFGSNYWYTNSTGWAFSQGRERVFADRVGLTHHVFDNCQFDSYNTTTVTVSSVSGKSHGLTAGDPVRFSGVTINSGNDINYASAGELTVASVTDRNTFVVTFTHGAGANYSSDGVFGYVDTDNRAGWDDHRKRLYIYSTSDPGGTPGGIDGGGETIEIPRNEKLFNVSGSDNVSISDLTQYGGTYCINYSPATAAVTSFTTDNMNVYLTALNRSGIAMYGNVTYNISGVEIKNCTLDKQMVFGEDRGFSVGSANGMRFGKNIGPTDGSGVAGDGVWIHNCAINAYGHSGIVFDTYTSTDADRVRNNYGLVEKVTFDGAGTNHMRAFAVDGDESKHHIFRNLLIKNTRSASHIGSSNSEYYNIIWDTIGDDLDPAFTSDPSRGGAFDFFATDDFAPDPTGVVSNNDIHDITIINSENAGIRVHGSNLRGGTGNTIRNVVLQECAVSPTPDNGPDGALINFYGGNQTQANGITWSNIVAYNSTGNILARHPDSDTPTYTTYAIENSPGTVITTLSNWSLCYDGDPGISAGRSYIPSNTGSAYNAGVDTGITIDYYNNPKPGVGDSSTAFDIGAVEYQDKGVINGGMHRGRGMGRCKKMHKC